MARFQFITCHPLAGNQLSRLKMSSATWTEAVNGNGAFSGSVTIPDSDAVIEQLKTATVPDESAVYVYDQEQGRYVWGGIIVKSNEITSTGQISIEAVEWRSWLYSVFLAPKVDLSSDLSYNWNNVDQLQIAREIVGFATADGILDGRPNITVGLETSGVPRDLNITGLQFKYAAELIDTMAQRDNGFEWTILIDTDPYTRLPSLRLGLFFPERGGVVNGLMFRKTRTSGNFHLMEDPVLDATERRSRVWTTGNTETSPFAQDSDPDLASGTVLLRESVTNYSTVEDRTTLADHARGEREYRSALVNTLKIQCPMTGRRSPADVSSYGAGDRARVIYQSRLWDLDIEGVRILDRTIKPYENGGVVEMTLDLSDSEMPEVDTEAL